MHFGPAAKTSGLKEPFVQEAAVPAAGADSVSQRRSALRHSPSHRIRAARHRLRRFHRFPRPNGHHRTTSVLSLRPHQRRSRVLLCSCPCQFASTHITRSKRSATLISWAVPTRALSAWREVPHQTQLVWNRLAEEVEPHRPPFDHKAYISGQNLFVSAYHGFATMGNEHMPSPVPFESFPPFAASLGNAVKMNGSLVIPARVEIPHCPEASCYRLLVKIQLTAPGRCRHLGLLRNYLAEGDCAAGVVSVVIPGYAGVWGFDLDQFQVYARFILLDSITGYRSQFHEYATLIRSTEGTAIGPASQED